MRIQKHKPLGNILIELNRSSNRFFIKQAIDYVTVNPLFNVYRREAFVEMKRAIDLSEEMTDWTGKATYFVPVK